MSWYAKPERFLRITSPLQLSSLPFARQRPAGLIYVDGGPLHGLAQGPHATILITPW